MGTVVLFLLIPVGLYVLATALPRGAGLAVLRGVGVLLALLWAAWAFSWPPFTGVARADSEMVAFAAVATLAAGLALLMQLARPFLARTGFALAYPIAASGVLVVALAVLVERLAL